MLPRMGVRGGLMSLYGDWQPGEPARFPDDQPMYKDARYLGVRYETSPDALEAVLPEPLEPGPRPTVVAIVADYPHYLGFDGRNYPYNELMLLVECRYRGEVGVAIPYIYIGARSGDFTDGPDVALCIGREGMGYPKKLANIDIRRTPDGWSGSVSRRGQLLLRYSARFGPPIEPEGGPTADLGRVMVVKEILAGDFTRCSLRQVWAGAGDWLSRPREIRTGQGTVEFGRSDLDPLDQLPPRTPGVFFEAVNDIWRGVAPELLADLLPR
jgi:hypothetical protein